MKNILNLNHIIMNTKTMTLSGKALAAFLNVTSVDYKSFPDINFGHESLDVKELLHREELTGIPEDAILVTEGPYLSGQIWMDTFYDIVYLYVGKLPNGKDAVINLGGNTGSCGNAEFGVINSGKDARIFFHTLIFSPCQ